MTPNQKIQSVRTALGLSEQEAAARAELTIYELGDIEAHADEFASAIPIRNAFRLCEVLGTSIYEVLGIDPPTGSLPISPGHYVGTIREDSRLSPDALDEKIGYEAGFTLRIENGSVDLLAYPVDLALDIAICTGTPARLMLNVLEQQFTKR